MSDSRARGGRKARSMLSSYYGIGEGDRSAVDSNDIDGTNFESSEHVNRMIKEQPLTSLVNRANELANEIKTLDSDMQMMVYENYNKFISAADAVKQMRGDVVGLESDIGELSSAIAEVSDRSDNVNAKLSERRQRIEYLTSIRRLLKKLSFIFELPDRLSRACELGAFAEAVKYWTASLPVLQMYADTPAFKTVHSESLVVLETIKSELHSRMRDELSSPMECIEAAQLLKKLGESAHTVEQAYMQTRVARLTSKLEQQIQDQNNEKSGKSSNQSGAMELSMAFLPEAEEFVTSCNSLTDMATTSTVSSGNDATGNVNPSSSSKPAISSILVPLLQTFFEATETSMLGFFGKPLSPKEDATARASSFATDAAMLINDTSRLHQLLPEGNVLTSTHMVVENVAKTVVSVILKAAQLRIRTAALGLVASEGQNSSKTSVIEFARAVKESILDAAVRLSPLTSMTTSTLKRYSRFLTDVVLDGIRGVLQTTAYQLVGKTPKKSYMVDLCTDADMNIISKGSDTPTLSLLVGRGWRRVLSFDLPKICESLAATLSGGNVDRDSVLLVFQSQSVSSSMQECSQEMLRCFVQAKAQSISTMIRNSIDAANWMTSREPRDIRLVVEYVVQEILGLGKLIQEIDTEQDDNYVDTANKHQGDRPYLVSPPELVFSRASILGNVLWFAFKTLLEALRTVVFSRQGYWQICVDVYYLRKALSFQLSDCPSAEVVLDAVISNAANRCTDLAGMDEMLIERICEGKLTALQST